MSFLLTDAVDQVAQIDPGREAIVFRKDRLTYGQLVTRSNQLAHALADHGVAIGDRVGVYLDKSLETAVAIYGIMKAGAAYVPLDPSAPQSRLDYVIRHCGIRHLVTAPAKRRALSSLLNQPGTPLTALLGAPKMDSLRARTLSWQEIAHRYKGTSLGRTILDQDLAYIMYTSGSTGEPKGIMHTHASGLSYARWARDVYGLQREDRLTNHAPLHFDLSTFDFFAGALAGAATVIVGDEYLKLPASYSQLLQDERITTFFTVPFALTQLLFRGVLDQRDLSALRWVIFGGEPFPTKHLCALMGQWPQARFSNMYGPAEVNGCTFYHVPNDLEDRESPIPIGTVWRNADYLIVNSDNEVVSKGEPGELLIRSSTMMQGYWQRDDLNKEAFAKLEGTDSHPHIYYCTGDLVEELEDGNLRFLGRRDRQIKSRGYRVELDEVEFAILRHPSVEEAAVFAVPDEEGSHRIEAAVVVHPDADGVTSEGILSEVKEQLPWYAVPAKLRIELAFPRTSSGKIDRRMLQKRASPRLPPIHARP